MEIPKPKSEQVLPAVTEETLHGIMGSVLDNPDHLTDVAKKLGNEQPELVALVAAYASEALEGKPAGDVAMLSLAVAYDALSRQASIDALSLQHPEL